jgi:hypothetical protein
MNDRIAELKSQCIVREQRGTTAFDSYMVDRFDTERFAELIIEECTTVIEKNLFKGIGWNTSRAVRRHFGIGEEEEE